MNAQQKRAFVERMARARKRNPSGSKKRKTRRRNPHTAVALNPRRRRGGSNRRRNPTILANPRELLMSTATALGSAVVTRQLPQMVLGAGNAGVKGYIANVAAAAAATFVAHEFLGKEAGTAAAIGGGVIILDRVLTEKFSPVGQYLSLAGLGDATAATRLGEVADGYYIHPTIYDQNGAPIIPHEITDAAVRSFVSLTPTPAGQQATAPAPAARQVTAGGSDRFERRW